MEEKIILKLCLNFCPYYKPGKDKTIGCGGFSVVKRLLEKGRKLNLENPAMQPCKTTKKLLLQRLCPGCQFYENDCDFVLNGKVALPCGGFKLLGYLLDKGIINIDNIPKSRYRHSKGLPLLSLRAPEGCVAIPQRNEIASASPRNDYFLYRDLGYKEGG